MKITVTNHTDKLHLVASKGGSHESFSILCLYLFADGYCYRKHHGDGVEFNYRRCKPFTPARMEVLLSMALIPTPTLFVQTCPVFVEGVCLPPTLVKKCS